MPRSALRLALVVLVALLALPAAAPASVRDVIDDCQDGVLNRNHSREDLRNAQGPASEGDIGEYTNCSALIARALRPDGSESFPGGNRDGLAPGDPAASIDAQGLRRDVAGVPVDGQGRQVDPESFAPERRGELARARAGMDIVPTAAGVRPDAPGTALPAPLVVLLAICALAALATVAGPTRRRLPFRRAAA